MINGVGYTGPTRIGQVKDSKVAATSESEAASSVDNAPVMTPSLVAALAEAGPPINDEKIKAIRSAIAQGRYPIDAQAIAQKMIALDLPN